MPLDERRDLFISLGGHLLLALPFVAIAWFLFATTVGDTNGAEARLAGVACVVTAGIIIARPLAGLVAEPAGSLFFPRHFSPPQPLYGIAEARRKQGRYEDAIEEYERVAGQFATEVHPYIAMMEIALVDLQDRTRAGAIVKRGMAILRDDASRHELLRAHRAVLARLRRQAASADI
jgi:hypothetical protein